MKSLKKSAGSTRQTSAQNVLHLNLITIQRLVVEGKKGQEGHARTLLAQHGTELIDFRSCREDGTFFMVGERKLAVNPIVAAVGYKLSLHQISRAADDARVRVSKMSKEERKRLLDEARWLVHNRKGSARLPGTGRESVGSRH